MHLQNPQKACIYNRPEGQVGVISRPGAARPRADKDGVTPVPPFLQGRRHAKLMSRVFRASTTKTSPCRKINPAGVHSPEKTVGIFLNSERNRKKEIISVSPYLPDH
jgi:hypothetical protein